MKKSPMALLITSSRDYPLPLAANLASLDLEVRVVESCQAARRLLEACPPVEIVITDVTLADGNWCNVLTFLVKCDSGASVVVNATSADERLWSEILWRGAYDMLVEPYESDEVRQVLEGALRAARSLPLQQALSATSS